MTTPTAIRPDPVPTPSHPPSPPPGRRGAITRLAVLLIGPVLVCLGLGLTYLSAFHHPQPNDLKVAIVGTAPETKVLAQTVKDKAGDGLNVVTVPTRQQARADLMDRELAGAFVPAPASSASASHSHSHSPSASASASASPSAQLLVAKAGSNATADAAEGIFRTVADRQGTPLKVTDVAPLADEDPHGGGLFFLLVALSVSSYISVLVLGPAADTLGMRVRAALGAGTAPAISTIGILLAGPVFGVVDHSYAAVWAMSLLHSAGVVAVGLGLHTFLKQWTPVVLMALFVMLNLTSAGGLIGPELQNDFYASLHSFWNGAGFVEGARSILYFDNAGLGSHLLDLVLWLAVGAALTLLAARSERRVSSDQACECAHEHELGVCR